MDVDALIAYYVERLVYQYRAKPKARATIAILVKQLLMDGLIRDVENAFGLDTAVGKQIDTLAKYIGVLRGIGPVADLDYFGFQEPGLGSNPNGFREYEDASVNPTGVWYDYDTANLLRTELSDYAFAFMLRWKAALNVWDGTLAGADALMKTLLPAQTAWRIKDVYASDGYIWYNITYDIGVDPETLIAYLPRPVGKRVRLTYTLPGLSPVDYYYP